MAAARLDESLPQRSQRKMEHTEDELVLTPRLYAANTTLCSVSSIFLCALCGKTAASAM